MVDTDQKYTIPSRWLNCPRRGELVAGKFVPIKTPLDENYNNLMPPANYWTPSIVLSCMKTYNLSIGLWVDLTYTSRFYDKETIKKKGISYVKLPCRGHNQYPSLEQTRTFVDICHKFISNNPLKLILVHCTHGCNRSGFLICAYLVEILSWSIDASIMTFKKCRFPGIYKIDYLKELYNRYGDGKSVCSPPPLADWCIEENQEKNEGNDNSTNMPFTKRKKLFHKVTPKFMDGVEGVIAVESFSKLSFVQQKCQSMCNWKKAEFPGSQPVSMTCNNLSLLYKKPYKVSWKADGTRYMMLIDGEDEIYFIDRNNSVFQVKGISFPRRKFPDEHLHDTLLDGEMIIDEKNGQKYPRYLVYDIVKFEKIDIGGCDFDRRMLCINKEVIGPREIAKQNGKIDRSKEPFSVRFKEFWDLSKVKALLSEKFRLSLGHEIDGLIFQPAVDPYKPGQCPETLKWKPESFNSVDFRLNIVREERPGMLRQTIGYLLCSNSPQPVAQIKVTKKIKDYDKKIIECVWDHKTNQWEFLRVRNDKSFPNSFQTAINVMESIKNPVTISQLLSFIDETLKLLPRNSSKHKKLKLK